jgi:rhamnose transport system substrate-binding protein
MSKEKSSMFKRMFFVLTILSLLIGSVAIVPAAAQDEEERWDGADDLPVNPLPCGDEEAPAPEPKDYDGGQPVDPPDLAEEDIVLVDVPKLVGIGYFAATTLGQQQAAEELGNVTVTTDAPTEPISTSRSPY